MTQWWTQCAEMYSVRLAWLPADGATPRYTQSWAVFSGTPSSWANSRTVNPWSCSHDFRSIRASYYMPFIWAAFHLGPVGFRLWLSPWRRHYYCAWAPKIGRPVFRAELG